MESVFPPVNTAEGLTLLAGIIISLLCSYAPGIADWYNKLNSDNQKPLVMLGFTTLAAVIVFALTCLNWYETGYACDKQSALELLKLVAIAAVSALTTHKYSPMVGRKTSNLTLPSGKKI